MHFDSLPSKKQEIIARISELPGPKFSVFNFLIGAVRFIVALTILLIFGSVLIHKCVPEASISLQWSGAAIQKWLCFLIVLYCVWTAFSLLMRHFLFKRRKEHRLRILGEASGETITLDGSSLRIEACYTPPDGGFEYARVQCVLPMEKISKVYIDTENERVIVKGNFHVEYGASVSKMRCVVLYDYFQPMMLPFVSNTLNAQYKRIVLLNHTKREDLIV